ncbi:methylaspartate mutase subunit E [Peribacillus simplex]|uniref:methylaspartate mutase subunit E n=1 Tax=Peribacillus simplex TaxID=1478 RepID=UPI003D2C98DC
MQIKNEKWTNEKFHKIRNEVLESWPTGKDVDLNESADYLKSLPLNKYFSHLLDIALQKNSILLQPRGGVATIDGQIKLLNAFSDAGAELMPVTIDSYTRQNKYINSERGLSESLTKKSSVLNGFPAVNHGVSGCRELNSCTSKPLQARHGSPDGRLLAEIIFASGWTSNEGGAISYNIPYSKNVSLEKSIVDWQYCDKLVGIYEEMGISLNREPFGPLTGTLVPPSVSNAVAIIEGLLAAEQGVKNISLGYGSVGHIVQDIAAMESLRDVATQMFNEYRYDVKLSTVFHQWMGNFPRDEASAYSVINLGSITAVMAKATKMIIKTPHEAEGIPTIEANVAGIKSTGHMSKMIKSQVSSINIDVTQELMIITQETKSIINKVFEIGKGDLAQGVIAAFKEGILDIPFSPSIYNKGEVLPIRDSSGAVRLLEFGNLPIDHDIKEYHKEKVAERTHIEKRKANYQMVLDDIYSISNGAFFKENF